MLEHLPGLHHFDGDLDSDGELVESSDEDEDGEGAPGGALGSGGLPGGAAEAVARMDPSSIRQQHAASSAPAGAAGSADAQMFPRMIALLEDLERRCYAGTRTASHAMLRTSFSRCRGARGQGARGG